MIPRPPYRGRGRTAAKRASGRGVKSDINVTPLVDVALVLLIVFMVVTPLLQRGEPVRLPRARLVSDLEHGGDAILLSVTADGRTFLDKTEIPRTELATELTRALSRTRGSPLVLRGDRSLDYGTIRAIVLEIAKTHVTGVSLAASPIGSGEVE